ncbi:MAG: thioredoxin [Patescibacteria group bacterium]
MPVLYLDEQNFKKETEDQTLPIVLDFYADWCGPCQILAPILEEVAKEFEEKVKVGKINVDKSPDLATKFQVMSIPTLIFLKNGEKVNEAMGAMEKEELKKRFEELLK